MMTCKLAAHINVAVLVVIGYIKIVLLGKQDISLKKMPGYGVRYVTHLFKCYMEDRHTQSGKDLLSFKNELHLHWGLIKSSPCFGQELGGLR